MFFVMTVARAVGHFFFHKHRKKTKKALLHSTTLLVAVDAMKAVGLLVGGEAVEHLCHVCGATGALCGAVACYLED